LQVDGAHQVFRDIDTGRWQNEVAGWKVDMGGALMPEINETSQPGLPQPNDQC
jgi:hypothetical protein